MKITDIKVKKMTTREKVDILGKRIRYQEPIYVKRKVKTISGGARFAHYLIDFLLILGIHYLLTIAGIAGLVGEDLYQSYGNGMRFQLNLMSYGITLLYYGVSEIAFGTTLGKFVFGRSVIDEYAQKPKFSDTLLRTLFRLVPFETFSCLGERGWHDKWSKTYVVSKEERHFLQKELGNPIVDHEDEILDLNI